MDVEPLVLEPPMDVEPVDAEPLEAATLGDALSLEARTLGYADDVEMDISVCVCVGPLRLSSVPWGAKLHKSLPQELPRSCLLLIQQ
ncbi:GL23432 [Drosophila persimilis]|uniref:GL23432 n=1 Tax=Drosophila persimilis TaxID=7234 RepID=B4G3Q5_DROPE|nr:GL23432 [Drosophila persimilis]